MYSMVKAMLGTKVSLLSILPLNRIEKSSKGSISHELCIVAKPLLENDFKLRNGGMTTLSFE